MLETMPDPKITRIVAKNLIKILLPCILLNSSWFVLTIRLGLRGRLRSYDLPFRRRALCPAELREVIGTAYLMAS